MPHRCLPFSTAQRSSHWHQRTMLHGRHPPEPSSLPCRLPPNHPQLPYNRTGFWTDLIESLLSWQPLEVFILLFKINIGIIEFAAQAQIVGAYRFWPEKKWISHIARIIAYFLFLSWKKVVFYVFLQFFCNLIYKRTYLNIFWFMFSSRKLLFWHDFTIIFILRKNLDDKNSPWKHKNKESFKHINATKNVIKQKNANKTLK